LKIAVISDIHANFVALKAVAKEISLWHPDFVVVCGDIINRGSRPLECLELIMKKEETENWLVLKGNHENYVINQSLPNAPSDQAALDVHRASMWTLEKIGDVSTIKSLPVQQSIYDPNGDELRFIHATMRGIRYGIYPETSISELKEKLEITENDLHNHLPKVYCVGHTHRTMYKEIKTTKIINVGSVGLPFDQDYRAAYATLEFKDGVWKHRINRLEYDRDKAIKDFFFTRYIQDAGPLIKIVLKELRDSRSYLYTWSKKYQKRVLNYDITIEDSVMEYLASIH